MAALLSRVDAVNREMTQVYKLVLECFKNSLNKRWTTGICRWTSLISVFFGVFFLCFYVQNVVCDVIYVDFYFYTDGTLSCLVHP